MVDFIAETTDIQVLSEKAPPIPDYVQRRLSSYEPEVFLQWNPKSRKEGHTKHGNTIWGGRWEIWVELTHSLEREASNERAETDRWNSEAGCWMRKLQTYETADGVYAPADGGLLRGLAMADSTRKDDFYKEHIEDPHQEKQEAKKKRLRDAAADRSSYYDRFDSAIVAPHSDVGKADWRHKIR